jgi:hypothetical protein|nr:MAG TPA: hypothetical protein [Caudoviricetes sp.]
MKKPIIAIFCIGNLPTKKEQSIINSLAHYPCVILNAETYTPQDSLIVDAVIGVVPEHLKHLPDPDTVIAQYEEYLEGVGDDVGGNPPEPPLEPPVSPSDEKGNGEADKAKDEQPKATAFGTPPVPPSDKK